MGEHILNVSCSSFQVFEALKQKAVSPSLVLAMGTFSLSQSQERVVYVTGFHSSNDIKIQWRGPIDCFKNKQVPMFVSSVDQGRPTNSII